MSFNVNRFKNELVFGGARPSLFQVQIKFPGLREGTTNGISDATFTMADAEGKLSFMCKAASIPASTVAPIEVPYFGRKVKVAGARTFAEWQITVINDEDFLIRKAFEHWLASINGHATNVKNSGVNSTPASYQAQAIVNQFAKDRELAPIRSYRFWNVFPSEVSPIELNWGTDGEIEEFTVTLQYDYWDINESGDIVPTGG